jgi:hypothetical protein
MVFQDQQERQEQLEEQEDEQQPVDEAPAVPPKKGKKRGAKRYITVNEADISPRPSFWPISLAFAVLVFLYGAIGNPYIMAGGAILLVVCVVGWGLERR